MLVGGQNITSYAALKIKKVGRQGGDITDALLYAHTDQYPQTIPLMLVLLFFYMLVEYQNIC